MSFWQSLQKNPTGVLIGIIVTSGKESYIVSFIPIFFYISVLIRIRLTMQQEKVNLCLWINWTQFVSHSYKFQCRPVAPQDKGLPSSNSTILIL